MAVSDDHWQLGTEGWTPSVCLVNILSATNRTLHCASFFLILCCVGSEDIMARRAWTGSDLNVPEMSSLHTEYITAGEQIIPLFWPIKIRLIIQKVNKTQLTLCISVIQTRTAFMTCTSTPKHWSEPPYEKCMWTYENGANFYLSHLGQYSKKSQRRKVLASVESSMGRKNKKCGIVYPSVAETRGSDVTSLRHQTASHWAALKATGVPTNPQNDAATNPPVGGRKSTVICVQE